MRRKAAASSSSILTTDHRPLTTMVSQTWAMLIKRVYEVDSLACPKCGGVMKVHAFIEPRAPERSDGRGAVVEKILRGHQSEAMVGGLWHPLVPRAPPGSQEMITQYESARPLAFAVMLRGNVQIMLQSQKSFLEEMPQAGERPIGATASFYIELPDSQQLYRQLQGRVKFLKELHHTFYGTEEFYIQDPNGYILGFASKLGEKTP
jgi:uncharacterized glyoxalase superfamily protein PhnB